MAIELNMRTKILAGVVVLAAAGAGAWFFLLQDEPPPPPPAAIAKPPATPAAEAAKGAPADAPKSSADAAKPAVEAAKPAPAKPIPTHPDKLIAEIIEISGVKAQMQTFGRTVGMSASSASQSEQQKLSEADSKAILDTAARIFEPGKMAAEVAAHLKAAFNADRMTRFLELLRQPIALKMAAREGREISPQEMAQQLENVRKNPPSAARLKLVQTLDDISQSSETGVRLATLTARETMDALFTGMQKAGRQVPKDARQIVGSQIVAAQGNMRGTFRAMLHVTYRDASDEELAEYVKLLDTDTGRWGLELLSGALRVAIEIRVGSFAREMAQVALRQQAVAKAPAAEKPAAEAAAEKPAAAAAKAAAAPKEPPAYRRPANIREVYTRYNDLITATVMRDRVAVKELLDDGKRPNVRQSDGTTPLMIAAGNGDADLVQMLLAKGADPNLRAVGGATALSIATERRRADVVQQLQRSGAKN